MTWPFVLLLLLIAASAVLLAVRRDRRLARERQQASACMPSRPYVIDMGDPDHLFYKRCLHSGFRYVGERPASSVHSILLRLPREEEWLCARVPLPDSELLLKTRRHDYVCACGGRLYDMYFTGPEMTLPTEFYGRIRAYRIGRICGCCGKVREIDQEQAPALSEVDALRRRLRSLGDGLRFIDDLAASEEAR